MFIYILGLFTFLLITASVYVLYEIVNIHSLDKKYPLKKIDSKENNNLLDKAIGVARSRARNDQCLLIKINGYPSVGKTTFINKRYKNYQSCIFHDFDKFSGIDRTVHLLVEYSKEYLPRDDQKIIVLFGSYDPAIESNLDEVIQLTVIPKFSVVCRNLILRKGVFKGIRKRIGAVYQKEKINRKWDNNENIMKARSYAVRKCYDPNGKQVQLIMSDFKEPLDILIEAYTECLCS